MSNLDQRLIRVTGPIGAPLRELRAIRGYTLVEVGERTGVSFQQVSAIERGDVRPRVVTVARILDGLGGQLVIAYRL